MTGRCTTTVYWWDIGVTVGCVRPDGHQGLHRDRTRWFDDAGFQQPRDTEQAPARRCRSQLTVEQIRDIRGRHEAGETFASISRALGVEYVTVRTCALRLTFRDVA